MFDLLVTKFYREPTLPIAIRESYLPRVFNRNLKNSSDSNQLADRNLKFVAEVCIHSYSRGGGGVG